MNSKKWLISFISILITLIFISAILTFIIDPYFHYRAPSNLSFYDLRRNDQRYVNNGIIRHFNYDAMILGTSHTENFKTSEFNNFFNCNAIKVPLAGAELKELAEQTIFAINHNHNLKHILYGITYEDIIDDKDASKYEEYPTYLYDDNIFNDYKYIFSGQVLKNIFHNIIFILNGKSMDFDKAFSWRNDGVMLDNAFSKEKVLSLYERVPKKIPSTKLNEEEKNKVIDNIKQNIINIVKDNKNIDFYLFLTPHSIVWWDEISQKGDLLKYLEAEEILINSLLEYENVKLYSFFSNTNLICDLNNYMDTTHYSEEISSQILKWIKNNEYLLTKENVNEYLKQEKEFYLNYNYDEIFSDK